MLKHEDHLKLIVRNQQGSIYITETALADTTTNFIKNFLIQKKLPLELIKVDFIKFSHMVNFQVNVSLSSKCSNFKVEMNQELQAAMFVFFGNEFQLEPLTINVITDLLN
ncbi:hypothetical protein [[Mycoplasma] testudinis]|uniref:hypothetical protein n=1 Tax=[Mycoplasma] testudinis TaxID=33924 RepID=UPI00048629AF|nr:hypothetical protein [[Mycoplasma] testudinis]